MYVISLELRAIYRPIAGDFVRKSKMILPHTKDAHPDYVSYSSLIWKYSGCCLMHRVRKK